MNNVLNAVRWISRHRKLVLLIIVIVLVAVLTGCLSPEQGGSATLAVGTLVAGVSGEGRHVVDGPLTTDLSREGSPDLLLNEIDRQIVKIRPMSTPLDQISRFAGSKHAGSMTVDYYNVDTKPTTAVLETDVDASAPAAGSDSPRVVINTSQDSIFDATDTILVQGVSGYEEDGVTESAGDLMLYVISRDVNVGVTVMAVNGSTVNGVTNCLPAIDAGTMLVRMGRAASELDVQSPQFEALPVKQRQFCQIFKMQVEQSTLQRLANKEVGWTMSDQQEAAIYDMRQGMEKSFLFGCKRRLWDADKKEWIMFTGGIWNQISKRFSYGATLGSEQVVELMRRAFTGQSGSRRKVLLGGSKLVGLLSQLEYTRYVSAARTVSRWGIDFTEFHTKFGTLYLLLDELFDEMGMPDNGIIIDPEYVQKYAHIPFSTEQLNLKSSGVRNTDALVLTEASCLVLRYPDAHMRIIKN